MFCFKFRKCNFEFETMLEIRFNYIHLMSVSLSDIKCDQLAKISIIYTVLLKLFKNLFT